MTYSTSNAKLFVLLKNNSRRTKMNQADYRQSHQDKKGPDYDSDLSDGGLNQYMASREADLLPALLDRHLTGHRSRYLDFACGSGRILSIFAPLFETTIAVDVSENMINAARDKMSKANCAVDFRLTDITQDALNEPPLRPDYSIPFLWQCPGTA